MNNKSVSLTESDIAELEKSLQERAADLTDAEKNFMTALISFGKAGRDAAGESIAKWSWTKEWP